MEQFFSALAKKNRFNVITVHFDNPEELDQTQIEIFVRYMRKYIQKLIEKLIVPCISGLHIIGIALGAHVAGRIGEEMYLVTTEKIARITGNMKNKIIHKI